MQKSPGSTQEAAHAKTRQQTNKAFYLAISDAVRKIVDSKEDACVLFIDKNHPPSGLASTAGHLDSLKLPKSTVLKTIAVLPPLSREL